MSIFGKKEKPEINLREQTANDYVNVLDIKNGLLYSKDHYVFAYIRVPPLALELMSIAEQEVIIRNLAESCRLKTSRSSIFQFQDLLIFQA